MSIQSLFYEYFLLVLIIVASLFNLQAIIKILLKYSKKVLKVKIPLYNQKFRSTRFTSLFFNEWKILCLYTLPSYKLKSSTYYLFYFLQIINIKILSTFLIFQFYLHTNPHIDQNLKHPSLRKLH